MFSGGDSSDGINSLNQFSNYGFVNQVAVSNAMAAGQNIDWAQLAQQWIQMRDNPELETKTNCDAVENKIVDSNCNNYKFEEKGEADMDMDDEEQSDDKPKRFSDLEPTSAMHDNLNQSSWFFSGKNSQLASSSNLWNSWQDQEMLTQPLPNSKVLNIRPLNPTAHIPSLLKINVPNPNETSVVPENSNQSDNTSMMDAAKRKGLPAWIREGLEKMERDKQKQQEKQRQNRNINSFDADNQSCKNKLVLQSIKSPHEDPATVVNDDSSDNEDALAERSNDVNLKRDSEEEYEPNSSPVEKTYEQKLSELMIVVRRTLTELLLEATNEEISKVADETIKIFKSKASSAQVIRKSALSSLTGKLGLAAYGDSSSENESEYDESRLSKKTSDQSGSDHDSEEEIRNTIRIKRRAFIKISEEIEERVIASAAREEEKLKYLFRKEEEEKEYNRRKKDRSLIKDSYTSGNSGNKIFKGYEKDFGEITETKIQHLNGKRQKERSSRRERITRFSDNKDKYVAIPNATTVLTNLNSGSNFVSSHTSSSLAINNNQQQNFPDINGLLPSYASTGMTNALSAADAALEKALKRKASTNREKQNRRRERDPIYNQSKKRRLSEYKNSRSRSKSSSSSKFSSSSSTSSDSVSSFSSRSSHHSKSKHRSAKKHETRISVERQYEKSNKERRGEGKHSSRSNKKRYESTSSRSCRNVSSDSEDDYRRRQRNDSNYIRNSSKSRNHTSSRYCRDREHSRSQSRSSHTSNIRRQ